MRIDFNLVAGAFDKRGMSGDVQEFREIDDALQARIESECGIPQGDEWGDSARILCVRPCSSTGPTSSHDCSLRRNSSGIDR